MRILVVDDEQDIRAVIRTALAADDVEVLDVPNGTAALALLSTTTVDVVVLDIMMPARSGYDVLDALRRDPALAHVAVVMLTARGAELDHVKAFRSGADAYLTKPFSIDELEAVVRRLAGLTAKERARVRDEELGRAELLAQIESRFS